MGESSAPIMLVRNAGTSQLAWSGDRSGTWTWADTRFKGGFGIYDAAHPWGPWTTAYFTEAWDVGPGETASFPTRWISDDGTTVTTCDIGTTVGWFGITWKAGKSALTGAFSRFRMSARVFGSPTCRSHSWTIG